MLPDPITYSINTLADVSKDISNMVVELSFLVMSALIVMVFAFAKNLNTARKGVFTALLAEYCFLVLCSTVIYRTTTADYNLELDPFWSYAAICAGGHDELIEENLLNVALGVPVGFLLSFIVTKRSWRKAVLVGFFFSSMIELSQLVFKSGLCEFDDVFHNTLGCLLGFGVGVLMVVGIEKIRKINS